MGRKGQHIGAERGDVDGYTPGRLDRVGMDQRPGRAGELRHLGDRLDHAGLVIRDHDRDQRLAGLRQHFLQGVEPDESVAIDRHQFDPVCRKASSREYRDMLDRADQQSLDAERPAGQGPFRRQHGDVRLGAAAGEGDVPRVAADERRHVGARHLDPLARGPSLAVDR